MHRAPKREISRLGSRRPHGVYAVSNRLKAELKRFCFVFAFRPARGYKGPPEGP